MNLLQYPEILEALEAGTINASTIGGVVEWIEAETGKQTHEVYIAFRVEILNFVEAKKNEAKNGFESSRYESDILEHRQTALRGKSGVG